MTKKKRDRTIDGESARSPFDRFASLTKRLVAVPKNEIARKAKAYERKRKSFSYLKAL